MAFPSESLDPDAKEPGLASIPALPPPLIGLSPGDLSADALSGFLDRLDAAREGGLRGLILREPSLDDGPLLELALAARARFARGAGFLSVHDRVHVALAAGADGVHLGWRSMGPREVQALLLARSFTLSIGCSTHAGDGPAHWQGAHWLVHGPYREVPGKAVPLAAVGPVGLGAFCARADLGVWALGGLEPGDAGPSRQAGARGLVVRRAIFGVGRDSRAMVRRFLDAWGEP